MAFVTANTSCVYITNSGKVKAELEKIHIQVGWLLTIYPQAPLYSLKKFFS